MVLELPLPSLEDRKLNGTNNFTWCDHVKNCLLGYGLSHHLTNEAPRENRAEFVKWDMEEYEIVRWMKLAMEPEIASKIMCDSPREKTCKEIWEYAQSLYSKDLTNLYKLWVKFTTMKQGSNMTTREIFNIFTVVFRELQRALPPVDDPKHKEMVLSLTFLQGLLPECERFIYDEILTQPELLPWHEIGRRLIAVEPYLRGWNRKRKRWGRRYRFRNRRSRFP